jgi:hypothetical protein
MTEEAANEAKLAIGNYVDLVVDKESGIHYLTTGNPADEANKVKQNGSKLGKSGSVYKFAAAKAWVSLGEKNAQVEYELGEGVEVGGKMYFPLIKGETIPVDYSSKKGEAKEDAVSESPSESPFEEGVNAGSGEVLAPSPLEEL